MQRVKLLIQFWKVMVKSFGRNPGKTDRKGVDSGSQSMNQHLKKNHISSLTFLLDLMFQRPLTEVVLLISPFKSWISLEMHGILNDSVASKKHGITMSM